ncbi:uncharacterized protein LOC108665556 [Hyalella azteca]|uniref:Uncharacterized protein LOC108665556 n=1 Tax=Hyalella azteca TaxID=294128 RepID=A0A8B7N1V4_HYAAZ|nr:uncharacterized protein LOC108665556 [Hyalella azteca]
MLILMISAGAFISTTSRQPPARRCSCRNRSPTDNSSVLVLWFAPSQSSSKHNFYGNVSFTIKWEAVQQKLGPNLYLIDQAIYKARSYTRVVFTKNNYDSMLKKVDLNSEDSPMTKSWSGFRHASHCTNKVRWGPLELQIAIEVDDDIVKWLYNNCKAIANNHSLANTPSDGEHNRRDGKESKFQSYKCFKFNTAQNSACPYQWNIRECKVNMKTLLATVNPEISHSGMGLSSFSTFAAPISVPVQSSKRTPSSHTGTSPLPTVQHSETISPRTLPTPAVKSKRTHLDRVKIPSENYSACLATSPNILSTLAISSERPAPRPRVKKGWNSYILPAAIAVAVFLAKRSFFKQFYRAILARIGNSRNELFSNAHHHNHACGIAGLTEIGNSRVELFSNAHHHNHAHGISGLTEIGNSSVELFSNADHHNHARGISGLSGIFHRLCSHIDAQYYIGNILFCAIVLSACGPCLVAFFIA